MRGRRTGSRDVVRIATIDSMQPDPESGGRNNDRHERHSDECQRVLRHDRFADLGTRGGIARWWRSRPPLPTGCCRAGQRIVFFAAHHRLRALEAAESARFAVGADGKTGRQPVTPSSAASRHLRPFEAARPATIEARCDASSWSWLSFLCRPAPGRAPLISRSRR